MNDELLKATAQAFDRLFGLDSVKKAVERWQPICMDCGKSATHTRHFRDVCPTDRGNEVREGEEWVCDECDWENEIKREFSTDGDF